MTTSTVRTSTSMPALQPSAHGVEFGGELNGYVAHVAKQLAKSGRLADMLNGGEELLRHVDPAAREALIKIAKAVRYALAQQSGAGGAAQAA